MFRSTFGAVVLALSLGTIVAANDTYVVVLDASGSMEDSITVLRNGKTGSMSRMEAAKEALNRTLPQMHGDISLGIVVFSAGNVDDDWIYPIGSVVREKVIAAIDKPSPSRGTPLGDYIKIGGDKLLEKRAKSGNSGRYHLIVVTDGENTEGHDPESYLLDAKKKGIEVSLIGVGMSAEHSLAKLVTSMPTPGTYQSAADTNALIEAVRAATKEAPVSGSGEIDPLIFEEISPLPDKAAATMLAAVSTYDNSPIGETPASVAAAGTTETANGAFGGFFILLLALVCGVIFVVVVMIKVNA